MSQRFLVTGGAGFIGSHLIERLIAGGHPVTCVDNFDPYYPRAIKEANLSGLARSPLVEILDADILDEDQLFSAFSRKGISTVIHLAARPGVRPSLSDPTPYLETNVCGTVNVLRCAVQRSVERIIFASSSSVYGSVSGKAREDRDLPFPLSPYAASKVAGEAFCQAYANMSSIPTTILRFFTAYGPRQRPDMAIHQFVRAIDQGQELTVFGDGQSMRDYTYIDDVINGVEAALTQELSGSSIFNLGSSRPVRLLDVVELIEKALGKRARIRFEKAGAGEPEMTYADVTVAARSLDYIPRIGIEEGIGRFVDWYREGSHVMAKAL